MILLLFIVFVLLGCAFFPVQLGDYCIVGEGTVVNAATVGNFVRFGKNSHIGNVSIISKFMNN